MEDLSPELLRDAAAEDEQQLHRIEADVLPKSRRGKKKNAAVHKPITPIVEPAVRTVSARVTAAQQAKAALLHRRVAHRSCGPVLAALRKGKLRSTEFSNVCGLHNHGKCDVCEMSKAKKASVNRIADPRTKSMFE
jgi:hypothetical protein